jgi:uncharacterized membrane protein
MRPPAFFKYPARRGNMPAYVVTWIHLLAAIAFIGGWIFMQLVVRPSLTENKTKARSTETIELVKTVGKRFKMVGWVSLMVLVFTGASQLLDESGSARIETSWGLIMMLKLFLFAIVGGLIFVHDLIIDPYGVHAKGRSEERQSLMLSGKVIWVQRTILVLSLAVLLIAAYLSSL